MKKVSSRKYKMIKTLDYIGVAFLLVILFGFWELYRGPISVPFLKPYIIQALNPEDESENKVSIGAVNIELVRSLRPINIIAKNVRYETKKGDLVIEAPNLSLSFSIKALLHGMIAPSRIMVERPKLSMFMIYGINEENKNKANQKKVEFYVEEFEGFVERFNSEEKIYPESYINDIVIKDAELEFHEVDLGKKISFSDFNYRFSRNFTNMEMDIKTLFNTKDRVASFGLNAKYKPSVNKLAMETYISDAYFSDLLETVLPEDVNEKIYNFDIPVNAKLEGLIDVAEILKNKGDIAQSIDKAIEKITFDVSGGNGIVRFSDDEKMDYPVKNFALSGEIAGGLDKILIEEANFDIDNEKIKLNFETTGLKKYFLEKSRKDIKIKLQTALDGFPLSKLSVYWPRYMGESAWQWCKDSIYGGLVRNAKFEFLFGYDKKSDSVAFEKLSGKIDIEDSNVDYLHDLPIVQNFYGTAEFSNGRIYIKVDKGVADGIVLNDGFIDLYDLDAEHNMIKIRLIGGGTIKDTLDFINHKPLELANEIGLPADKILGDVEANLLLAFELKNDLDPSEVNIELTADLKNVEIKDVFEKKSLKADVLELIVDNKGVKIIGDADFDSIPLKFAMNERFDDKNYKSKYEIAFKIDEDVKKKLGIDFPMLGSDYINGYAYTDALFTIDKNNQAYIELNADLLNSEIDYDFLGFVKPYGEDASIYAKILLKDGDIYDIPDFKLSKYNFDMKGNIKVDKKNKKITAVDITDIKGDKMNASAKIEFKEKPDNIMVNVSGYSYDLTTFFDRNDDKEKKNAQENNEQENENEIENVPNMDIFVAVSNMWTNPEVPLKNFSGKAILRNGIGVHELHIAGNYGNNEAIKMNVDYIPKQNGEYKLSIDSNNAGTTLKVLRFYDHMQGGNLKIEARRDLNKQFFGHAQIRNFNIHNAPMAAKVFTVASFTGMLNLLAGDGIAFSHFDAPFEYYNGELYIKNARAFGNVLGVSGNGTLNKTKESLNIKGVIAPAYSLNTFLGKIPLVGNLLSGKDGTVFAASYDIGGSFDNPEISVNPLSALSPNSLKDLFGSIWGEK